MLDVNFTCVSEKRLERLRQTNKNVRNELYNKLDLLNTLYGIVFPNYVPEGSPLCSMPFSGDPENDRQYAEKLVDAVKHKFKE